jgi:hypothetical protein
MLALTATLMTAPVELDAGERATLPLILDTPTSGDASLPTSEALDRLTALIAAHTDFAPREIPSRSIDGCKGSIACIALRMRSEVDRRTPLGVVVSILTSEGSADRVTALLIDLDEAARCAEQPEAAASEACALERGLLAKDLMREVADEAEARAHLERIVLDVLRPPLERLGRWEPFGTVDLEIDRDGATISIDGKTIGVAPSRVQIIALRPGDRKLTIAHPGANPASITVAVGRGGTASARVVLESNLPAHAARHATLWSGAALAAIGGVLALAAIIFDAPTQYCVTGDCRDTRFTSLGTLFDPPDSPMDDVHHDVLAVPLGYSLAATGACFILGALFEGERHEVPWISIIAGVAAGGLAYGLSAALDAAL